MLRIGGIGLFEFAIGVLIFAISKVEKPERLVGEGHIGIVAEGLLGGSACIVAIVRKETVGTEFRVGFRRSGYASREVSFLQLGRIPGDIAVKQELRGVPDQRLLDIFEVAKGFLKGLLLILTELHCTVELAEFCSLLHSGSEG